MKGLTQQDIRALRLFKQRLVEQFPNTVASLQLFGSKARGEASKFSDVDVLVVLDQGSWRDRRAVHVIAHKVFLETDVDLSPVIMSSQGAARLRQLGSPLLSNIEREGLAL